MSSLVVFMNPVVTGQRCFAFFHPQLPDEPLIFVEVALVGAIPRSIAQLIGDATGYPGAEPPRVAEVPSVKRYCTLSPVPGLRKWLARAQGLAAAEALRSRHGADLERLAAAVRDGELGAQDQALLCACAATFLVRHGARPLGDAVARFHLDNGARLERINLAADLSDKGLRESFGVMVNYLYDLGAVESNHERFVRGEAVCSRQVLSAARG